jgi:hypothetical protein
MNRIVWLLLIALVVGLLAKPALRLVQGASTPKHKTYSEY